MRSAVKPQIFVVSKMDIILTFEKKNTARVLEKGFIDIQTFVFHISPIQISIQPNDCLHRKYIVNCSLQNKYCVLQFLINIYGNQICDVRNLTPHCVKVESNSGTYYLQRKSVTNQRDLNKCSISHLQNNPFIDPQIAKGCHYIICYNIT